MQPSVEKEPVKTAAKYFAHTATLPDGKPDRDQGHWQLLSTHLRNVAHLAKEFVPDYVRPSRDDTALCATRNHGIPAFLEIVFDQPTNISAN
ncbi:MAG TPA: hypothetical protein VFT34_01950 [Verrucomicrobiae bacterium]|nr:hypothetical protein [Verrucomicrobiae bacterium]